METCFLWKTVDNAGYNLDVPSARDPEFVYPVFGRRLRELREARRVPQEELATFSGLTRASIANIESGRQRVLLHQILKFAEALRVELSALVPSNADLADADTGDASVSHIDYLQRIRDFAGINAGDKSE